MFEGEKRVAFWYNLLLLSLQRGGLELRYEHYQRAIKQQEITTSIPFQTLSHLPDSYEIPFHLCEDT